MARAAVPRQQQRRRDGPEDEDPGALVLLDDSWEFVQISNGVRITLEQDEVYTAIIRAILSEFCDVQVDMALKLGFSVSTIKSWSSGRRIPSFGTIKLILLAYGLTFSTI